MRYLGVDYGRRRIGLALSDPEGRIAFPLATVGGIGALIRAARDHGVGAVVIGLARPLPGRRPDPARATRAFAAGLRRALQLPVMFEDEMFTTKIAERHTPEEKADASAAALILQSYLDRLNAER